MKSNKYLKLIILFFAVGSLFAQSSRFQVSWDASPEGDNVVEYEVYRSTSAGANTVIATVAHPSTSYNDESIEKGIQYFYRTKAVNDQNLSSPFSDEVSAAIPKIEKINSFFLAAGEIFEVNLDTTVTDPDDSNESLVWEITGNSNINVTINDHFISITAPTDWSGSENLIFSVNDEQGFTDVKQITVTVGSNDFMAPVFSDIPDQNVAEDDQVSINLENYVSDQDSDINDLTFGYEQANSIEISLNNTTLNLKPAANWNGQAEITVNVEDETNLAAEETFVLNVLAVNDAPVLAEIPSQTMIQNETIELYLGEYISDVDNDNSQLNWVFDQFNQLDVIFSKDNEILTITSPVDWEGFEHIRVSVNDPENASDSDSILVRVIGAAKPPVISNLPSVAFDEDDTFLLDLNTYVADEDDPDGNLLWYTSQGENVNVNIDPSSNQANFSAKENWYGVEFIWFYVQDPEQNIDSTEVQVTVVPINDRPVISGIPSIDLSAETTKTIDLKNYTQDVDNPMTDIQWNNEPHINITVQINADGIATFSVDESWNGQAFIDIIARDPFGMSDTAVATIIRQDLEFSPTISGLPDEIFFEEDNEFTILLDQYVQDKNNTPDQMIWSFSNNANIQIQISDQNEMKFTPNVNWFGNENIYLQVQDPDNNLAFDTLNVVVSSVNDAPVLQQINSISLVENSVFTFSLLDYLSEPDGTADIAEIILVRNNNGFIGSFVDFNTFQISFFSPMGFYGSETFLLSVTDKSGENVSQVIQVSVFENTITSSIQVDGLGSETNYRVSWETVKPTKDKIEYGTTPAYGFETNADPEFTTTHSHIIAGLEENTTYYFRIISQSIDGRITYSADSTITTGSINKVNVFPIPYRASLQEHKDGIFFTNLPSNGKLIIFNLLGEPVYEKDELPVVYRWNVKNNASKDISSGLYFYVIRDNEKKKVKDGKIVIIR